MLLRGGTGAEFDFQENHGKSEPKLLITPLKNDVEIKIVFFQKSENTKMPLNLRVKLENFDVFSKMTREIRPKLTFFKKHIFHVRFKSSSKHYFFFKKN